MRSITSANTKVIAGALAVLILGALLLLSARSASATEGDVFAAGTEYCASTYDTHATIPEFEQSVDINVGSQAMDDLDLPLYAPESGFVEIYTVNGNGDGGWGNSII